MIFSSANIGGKEISFEYGKVARQGNGVIVKCNDTVILCTACVGKKVPYSGFSPLSVHYIEKFSSNNKIPGGYKKREGKPNDQEVLNSRIIDRSLRPLVKDGFSYEMQVVCTVFSYSGEACEVLAIAGASLALKAAGVPCELVSPAKVSASNVNFHVNENNEPVLLQSLNEDKVVIFDLSGCEVEKKEILSLKEKADIFCKEMRNLQTGFLEKFDSLKVLPIETIDENIEELVNKHVKNYYSALKQPSKIEKIEEMKSVEAAFLEDLPEGEEFMAGAFLFSLKENARKMLISNILSEKTRLDGRGFSDLRKIDIDLNFLPKLHGHALFTRGDTQALVSVTVGSMGDEQSNEMIHLDQKEKVYLYYNFPSYSVGEIGRIGAPGRREIGHGYLALRGILPVVETSDEVLRIVSDITESYGSSSMASVCGASLALFSAGANIKRHVAGISLGLIENGKDWKILTDITGDEDSLGLMDFKISGTSKGINAISLDIKTEGISLEVIEKAIDEGLVAIGSIIKKMEAVISVPNKLAGSMFKNVFEVHPSKIGLIIGKAGATIKSICEKFSVKINIEDSGEVSVLSLLEENVEAAVSHIQEIIKSKPNRKS